MTVDCKTTIDTTGFSDAGNIDVCGRLLTAALVDQNNGSAPLKVVLIASSSLGVQPDASVSFLGPYPVILAVYGAGQVDGILSAAAGSDGDAGPGADHDTGCNAVTGTTSKGGGGGGFGTNGGNGGGNGGSQGHQVGANMNPLRPLEGGCSGAPDDPAGGCVGGGAGGALQISASGNLAITGTIDSSGSGGVGGDAGNPGFGGGGGGSGGALLLEANRVSLTLVAGQRTGALTVNGGGGGGGGFPVGGGNTGTAGQPGTNTAAPGGLGNGNGSPGGQGGAQNNPMDGTNPASNGGGGGGGGSVGYIRVNAASCNLASGTVRSGNYSNNGGTGCN
jgi:hypothetical protein